MKEKKGVNYSVIAVAVVAVALVAVAAVLGIKMHNGSSIPAVEQSDTQPATDSIFSSITTTIAQVISDNTVTVPESRTQAQTNPAKTTTPATKPADVTVPQLKEEDLSHASAGSNKNVVTPSGNLPQDMSFAGLMRLGYNVIGLKEYIYNNDTDPNCTQRKFGYNSLYDAGASLIDFTIDTVSSPSPIRARLTEFSFGRDSISPVSSAPSAARSVSTPDPLQAATTITIAPPKRIGSIWR